MTSEYLHHPYLLKLPVTITAGGKTIYTCLSFYSNFAQVTLITWKSAYLYN